MFPNTPSEIRKNLDRVDGESSSAQLRIMSIKTTVTPAPDDAKSFVFRRKKKDLFHMQSI